ncbi:Las1-like-domain-containing protein [Hyaloraphidium curvatum]|nr:Las1-like-domain-containing protein [Hyaloraphidium curvatum]
MPSSLRPVPWADEKEWRNVYADLYAPADGTIRRQRGVQRVKTWRSRGKVPHAADVTASFVEVQLRDERNEDLKGSVGERSAVTDHELRLMYTMVFIRFVNGLVDPEQKSQYARSVASIAEQLNLPAWFVDLRHAGTHDKLPSLPLLRSGCRQALDWLNSFYWRVRADEESRAMAEVEDLLEEFSAAVNAMLDEGKVAGEPGSTKAVASKLLSLGGWRRHIVSGTLRPGRLLPPKRAPREAVHARLSLWATLVKRLNEVWPHFSANLIADAADIVWGKRVATGQPVLGKAR